MTELINRIIKRHTHLKKWASRHHLHCYRIYDRELTNYPLIIDWYEGDAIVWITKEMPHDPLKIAIAEALSVPKSRIFIKERFSQKGLSTQHKKVSAPPITKTVTENGLKFEINLTNYLDTGLFLDHRKTRQKIRELSQGKRVLNLFAYTGSFTCYAIAGGAIETVTVDMNPNYIQWADRNLTLNHWHNRHAHQLIVQDCLAFLTDHRPKHLYDLIICDPPTFSNSKRMKSSFSVDRDYPLLLNGALRLLAPKGIILFSNNSRQFKLDPAQIPANSACQEITAHTVSEDFKSTKSHRSWMLRVEENLE